jgi:hypothetical protein
MAKPWIKMRTDLARDPAVIQLSERYGFQEHVIVGLLHKLWSWADEQIADGNAPGVTEAFIDRFLGIAQFATALSDVGWLEINADGIAFPNWDRHMSKSAKTRAVTTDRVNKLRNAGTVTKSVPEQSSIEETETATDLKALSFQEIESSLNASAKALGKPTSYPDRRFILVVCILTSQNKIATARFESALEAVRKHSNGKPGNPMGYFRSVLQDEVPEFEELVKSVRVSRGTYSEFFDGE